MTEKKFRETRRVIFFESEQMDMCEKHKAVHTPPRGIQLIVISDGVYEGKPLEGVRYPSPDHMSGWWLNKFKTLEPDQGESDN